MAPGSKAGWRLDEKITFASERDMPPLAVSLGTMLVNKTGTWRYMRPVYEDKTPPCNHACPAGEKIQGYLELSKAGEFGRAWELIMEDNPLPSVCGRVCYHPCEQACNRSNFDEPLAIHHVERFLGDYGLRKNLKVKSEAARSERVAVVGAGPAGLSCAYHLARRGYAVTIYEAQPVAGGMLAVGIPRYRLPRDILEKEIANICSLGVEIKTGIRIGLDIALDDLSGHQAVFIATGQHQSTRLDIPGQEARGVIYGLDLLRDLNLGRSVEMGRRVAVIGGGNTAMDAARSAVRQGAKVTVVYRRSREEMPAIPEEILEAEEEGVQFLFLSAPKRVLVKNAAVGGLECRKMRLGEPDQSGRRRPIPVDGTEFILDVDTVIGAIGQEADLSFLPSGIAADRGGIQVDDHGVTTRPGTFSGGDVATGAGTVTAAIGSGKKAALAIHRYLSGERMEEAFEPQVVAYEEINLDYFEPAARQAMPCRQITERLGGFVEVVLGYTEAATLTEAQRCFSCGVCNHCDTCWLFCPDVAIAKLDHRDYLINYDYCKGCGVCVEECPRSAISMEEEMKWKK